jgi:transposase InsO family protein
LLKHKSEVPIKFQEYSIFVETQYNAKIKILRTDNGTEYVNNCLSTWLEQRGIDHQTTCVYYTPQQNDVSEKKNRHLLEVTRALMFQSNVPR